MLDFASLFQGVVWLRRFNCEEDAATGSFL